MRRAALSRKTKETDIQVSVDLAVMKLAPIGAEMKRLQSDTTYLDSVLRRGSDRAREQAAKTMAGVKDILGFIR